MRRIARLLEPVRLGRDDRDRRSRAGRRGGSGPPGASRARARRRRARAGGRDEERACSRRCRTSRTRTATPSRRRPISSQFAGASSRPAAMRSAERSTPTTLPTNGANANASAPAPHPLSSARSVPASGASSCCTRSLQGCRALLLDRHAICDHVTHRRPHVPLGWPARRSRRRSHRESCLKRVACSSIRMPSPTSVTVSPVARSVGQERPRSRPSRPSRRPARARPRRRPRCPSCRAGSRPRSRPARSRSGSAPSATKRRP